MSNIYLSNAFSVAMLDWPADVRVEPTSLEEVKSLLKEGFVSCIGHEATARLFSALIGIPIPANRIPIKLQEGDCLIVGQVMTRLPEGKVLSEAEMRDVPIQWVRVYLWRGWAVDEGNRWAVWPEGVPPTLRTAKWRHEESFEKVAAELGAKWGYQGDDPWNGPIYLVKDGK
jgi:hypothetical protein